MSTETNGTTGRIDFGGPGVVTDAVTWISLAKRLAGGAGWASILEVRNAAGGGGAASGGIGAHGVQLGRLYGNRNGVALTVAPAGTEWPTTAGWVLQAFAFPAAGASLGRWHRHEFGVGTTHGDGDNSLAAGSGNWLAHYMGGPSDPVQARFGMGAFLRGLDMTDGQFDSIVASLSTASVAAIAPAGSAVWDASDDFATNLINPGTFDRVAITGHTHDVADDPAGWVYGGITLPVIPITVVGAGAVTFGTAAGTTVAPPIPTHQAGDLLVAVRGMKHSSAESLTAEAGWTRGVAEQAGGAGSFAADTGPTKVCIDYLEATGSGTTVTFDNTAAANTVAWAQVIVLRKGTPGASWAVAGVSGTDNSAGAAYSVAFGSNPSLATKDYVVVGVPTPTDVTAAHWGAATLTATGLTAVVTEQGDAVSGNGFDIGAGTWTCEVTAGPATANPTFAATATGTTTNIAGPCALLRVRADATPLLVTSPP